MDPYDELLGLNKSGPQPTKPPTIASTAAPAVQPATKNNELSSFQTNKENGDTTEDAFSKLLERAATDQEKQQLLRARDALGLKNNDALWMVLVALQYHQTLYAAIPGQIEQAGKSAALSAEAVVKARVSELSGRTLEMLASGVARTAEKVADQSLRTNLVMWSCGAMVVSILSLIGVGWVGFKAGHRAGFGEAQTLYYDEKAAVAWANTADGKAAKRLADLGQIEKLAECSGEGWFVKDGVCYVRKTTDGYIRGWRIR